MEPKVCEHCGRELAEEEPTVDKEWVSAVETFGPAVSELAEPVYFHRACWGKATQSLFRDPS